MNRVWLRGDVLQLKHDMLCWGGELMVVTEGRPWGAVGVLALVSEVPHGEAARLVTDGVAYMRVAHEHATYVGHLDKLPVSCGEE